jgi:RNA polymerase sigma-70 factor, ECF subfamily
VIRYKNSQETHRIIQSNADQENSLKEEKQAQGMVGANGINQSTPALDAALLKRITDGDSHACRVIMDRHLKPVHALAYRMLGNRCDAEEVAQEVFLRLWKQAPRWKSDALVNTWLHKIAHNLCLDKLRRKHEYLPGEMPEKPDPAAGPSEIHYQKQVAQQVSQALTQLPERQNIAINLIHYQGIGNIEAARIMDVTVEALESLLARGRRGLKKQLQEHKLDLLEGWL